MPEPIEIDKYVDRLRRGLNDCLEFQDRYGGPNWDEGLSDEELERAFEDKLIERYDRGGFSAHITKEEASHALEALNFFSDAKDFLASVGHEISFYTLDEEYKERGFGGFYRSTDQSIHIPVEKDMDGNYNSSLIDKSGLGHVSTMAHEILHAVDHFTYLTAADSIPTEVGAEADTERLHYDRARNSYAALEMNRFLGRHCNATQEEWEKETADAFSMDLERPFYSDYKGKFVTEVVPRLAESKFLHDDLTPQISDITSPNNQALTHHVMYSYQQQLKRLGEDGQIPLSLQEEGKFLDSCTEMLGDIAVGMKQKAAPQLKPPSTNLIDMDDAFELVDDMACVRKSVREGSTNLGSSNGKQKMGLLNEKQESYLR